MSLHLIVCQSRSPLARFGLWYLRRELWFTCQRFNKLEGVNRWRCASPFFAYRKARCTASQLTLFEDLSHHRLFASKETYVEPLAVLVS